MIRKLLTYPLQTEALTAGALFYAMLSVLFIGASFGWRSGGLAAWVLFAGTTTLLYVSLWFEYGLDLLADTAAGKPRPPTLRASLVAGGGGKGGPGIGGGALPIANELRFVRQVILHSLLFTTGWKLYQIDWHIVAWIVWLIQGFTLPATMAANVLFERITAMMNPRVLFDCIRHSGWYYPLAIALLALDAVLGWICITGRILHFLLLAPVMLYCSFLSFHVMGLGIHRRYDELFPPVDFKADRQELAGVSNNLGALNNLLTDLHELLRTGKHALVAEKLVGWLDRGHWPEFEQVYRYTAEWFDVRPAVHVTRHYLGRAEADKQPMRSLALAVWGLNNDPAFTVDNAGALLHLAGRAVTPSQLHCALAMLENHLRQYPDSPRLDELQELALQLAAHKLQDEAWFRQLQKRFRQ